MWVKQSTVNSVPKDDIFAIFYSTFLNYFYTESRLMVSSHHYVY